MRLSEGMNMETTSLVPRLIPMRPCSTRPRPISALGLSPVPDSTRQSGGNPFTSLQNRRRLCPAAIVAGGNRQEADLTSQSATARKAFSLHCFVRMSMRLMPLPSPASIAQTFPAKDTGYERGDQARHARWQPSPRGSREGKLAISGPEKRSGRRLPLSSACFVGAAERCCDFLHPQARCWRPSAVGDKSLERNWI